MKTTTFRHLLAALSAVALTACHSDGGASAAAATADTIPAGHVINGLRLPDVPSSITSPGERATFIVDHFWDYMDFADTARSHSRDFMEQSFANYASLFPLVEISHLGASVAALQDRAGVDSLASSLLAGIADKYLYDPNSPMLNEDYYELFLPSLIADTRLDSSLRDHYRFQLDCIHKNCAGTLAANFTYRGPDGAMRTLYTTATADRVMLLFFDPDCDHCREVISMLRSHNGLNEAIAAGQATVIAICAEGGDVGWELAKSEVPDNWIAGQDRSGIEDHNIYVLRAMPTIYLLDADKRVTLKDALPERALAAMLGDLPHASGTEK